MSKKQKEKKKTEKKKLAKHRVEVRRKETRAELKKLKEENKLQRKYAIKPMPYKKNTSAPADMVFPYEPVDNPAKDEAIKKRLEHNMKILEALQAEMDREEFTRDEANSKLENDGAKTLREKMDMLAERAEGAMIQFDELGINEAELNMNWNLNTSVDLDQVSKLAASKEATDEKLA